MRSCGIQSLRPAPISFPTTRRKFRSIAAAAPLSNAHPLLAFQVKQAEMILERLSTGLTAEKVLDKVTTVIAGQTTVEPDILDKQLKAITTGEEYNSWDELRSEIFDGISNSWSSSVDLLTNFNPLEFADWFGALFQDFAERFAAWELSSLVALGERWLIWTPIVVLPMAWQMSKTKTQSNEEAEIAYSSLIVAAATMEKQERVKKAMERMKLRSLLMQEVEATKDFGSIQDLVKQLQELGSSPDDETLIDGNWQLLYASQELSIFSRFPGLEITELEQRISRSSDEQMITAHNFATLRISGVGAIKVELQGSWNRKMDTVVFDKITAGVVQVFESPVSWDVSKISLAIPVPQSERWKLLYMDDEIRVNQGSQDSLYVFSRTST